LRHIRAGGKAAGYPIATIKAAAVWLIESYSEANRPDAGNSNRDSVSKIRGAAVGTPRITTGLPLIGRI
jgi:hypothetical protein